MEKQHNYSIHVKWTGNLGKGTFGYKEYERSHTVGLDYKPEILCSSDLAFGGDRSKYNPEELLLASLSACHMLWYLHFCAVANVIVTNYTDQARGIMIEKANGSGYFSEVYLKPIVVVTGKAMIPRAIQLHKKANEYCFIANSMNFKIHHSPQCLVREFK